MGRVAEGWKFTNRRGVYGIRWRDPGNPDPAKRRPEVSLRTTDINEAKRLAPVVYAQHVGGAADDKEDNAKVSPTTKLKPLVARWLDAIKIQLGRGTDETYIIHANHWLTFLKTIGDIRSARIDDYQNARLKVVQRSTLELEIATLRKFLKWLKVQEYIRRLPEFPVIGDHVLGTRFAVRRRSKPTEVLTPEEMDRIIESMDTWSIRRVKGKYFPVRARFEVARETGLRPITIDNLVGRDVTVAGLNVRTENDKNRWGRVVPLTERARAALESVLPANPDDLIFGHHEWDKVFYRYAVKALGEEKADKMVPYDLKHGLVTELFDNGLPETSIQFLTGTKSAIRRYSHPTRRAAEEAVSFMNARNGGRTGDGATGGHWEQHKTSRIVRKAAKSYLKPNSKNPAKSEASRRKKARV